MSHQQPSRSSSAVIQSHLLIDPHDAAFVLLDHQSGLLQTIKDISIGELRANTTMLARLAALLDIPVITSASVPDGPNGPLMPEIHEAAPHATYVTRKGEINAWDSEEFVNTVRDTGKHTLVMAGVWTSVCVALPALAAIASGYRVFVVHDASGDPSEFASRITMARLAQAGATPTSASAVLCEFQRHWNRPNNHAFAELYVQIAPNYGAVVESFRRAQAAAHKAHLATA
jgi:nicotinamidase-related amidase